MNTRQLTIHTRRGWLRKAASVGAVLSLVSPAYAAGRVESLPGFLEQAVVWVRSLLPERTVVPEPIDLRTSPIVPDVVDDRTSLVLAELDEPPESVQHTDTVMIIQGVPYRTERIEREAGE